MSEIGVYTALFGDRSCFNPPTGTDFHMTVYTDKTDIQESDRVRVMQIPMPVPGDPVRSARFVKMNPHIFLSGPEITLWIDASMVLDNVIGLERFLEKHEVALFPHPDRICTYDEEVACESLNRDDPTLMRKQMARYRAWSFPEKHGLVATGGLLRRNNPSMASFNMEWWFEVFFGSRRDQLSFNFVAWRRKMLYAELTPGSVYQNQWWHFAGHARSEPAPLPRKR